MKVLNKSLKRRIIQISYDNKLSHLGSCLTAVDIIKEIYDKKKKNEKFVLSAGHAGLALYVVLEQYGRIDAETIFKHHGVHPDRCNGCGIDVSSGSLGNGLGIAVGMALADRSKNVYCLISDGECSEGSIWEALRIAEEQKLTNLKIQCNWNGWGAYKKISTEDKYYMRLPGIVNCHYTSVEQLPFLKGQNAHYAVMSENDYNVAMEILK